MQTGSAFILIGAFAGAAPSNDTTPLTDAAVAESTAAAAGADGCSWLAGAGAGLLPPHAAAPNASMRGKARNLECIENSPERSGRWFTDLKPLMNITWKVGTATGIRTPVPW